MTPFLPSVSCRPSTPPPVELDPRRRDQGAISDARAVLEHDPVALGLEGGDRASDPSDALRHHGRHGTLGPGAVEHAAADQRPARLVVVALARLDHRDPERGPAPQQARRGRETRRAAADDHHVVGLGGAELDHPGGAAGQLRGPPAHVQTGFEGGEVVAGLSRGREDHRRVEVARLGERPERRRAGAGAAEREHRTLDLLQSLGEGGDVVVGDLAGDRRHVPVVQADPLGGGRERGTCRLVLGFAVGPVVDDGPEALGGERAEIGLGDLRRDGQKWRELGDFHGREPPLAPARAWRRSSELDDGPRRAPARL